MCGCALVWQQNLDRYRESCVLPILSKVMTGWQRNCCVHFFMFEGIMLAMKECFQYNQVSVWAQWAVQYCHMLNVLAKHQWVGEEVGKDLRVALYLHTSLYLCGFFYTLLRVCVPACVTPVTCMPVLVHVLYVSLCDRCKFVCTCGVTAIKYF